jgi:hypothetical protein
MMAIIRHMPTPEDATGALAPVSQTRPVQWMIHVFTPGGGLGIVAGMLGLLVLFGGDEFVDRVGDRLRRVLRSGCRSQGEYRLGPHVGDAGLRRGVRVLILRDCGMPER